MAKKNISIINIIPLNKKIIKSKNDINERKIYTTITPITRPAPINPVVANAVTIIFATCMIVYIFHFKEFSTLFYWMYYYKILT